ncbi:DUF4376 domain-containing protein [Pectobacterium carotovorum]|uniref:DUF4376 domain-containing protein n=1 Tax=Pectobacterium carotovorum TaxID=554 RepID=UPI002081DD85|nr:DUF4376 domain-containing protein [Pectobacterium carotovorum]GKV88218.1 hypothetical protein PEC301619_02000 [Pectobacterium carotovorum subsp. carotovorum]
MQMRYWLRLDNMQYEISGDDMTPWGFIEVPKKPEPHQEIYAWDINKWDWGISEQLARGAIALSRYEKETAGITFNGNRFHTTDRSKTMLCGAAIKCLRDENKAFHWKTIDGQFIELSSVDILALHDAVIDYVESCFSREQSLVNSLLLNELTAEMIDEGWPSNNL